MRNGVKTLNITGELETYTHKNGFTHTKVAVTYQDKTTNKVNYLEIDVLDNTNNKVENTKNCTSGCTCPPGYIVKADYCPTVICTPDASNPSDNSIPATCNGDTYGTVTMNTAAGGRYGSSAAKTGKTFALVSGTQVAARTVGTQYKVFNVSVQF
jgi:hypothetical protein